MPIDDSSRAVLRNLVGRIDVDEQVARVLRGIEGMPEYQGFVAGRDELGDRGPAAIRWNLEIFLRWAGDGGAPTAAELGALRELIGARAAEGRPPEEGLAVYRRAMRVAWEVVLEAAEEPERVALGGAFDLVLEWLDIVSQVFEQAYAEERDTLVSQDERRARSLFERIDAGDGDPGPDGQRLADALGFRLAATYRPLVAVLAGGSAAEHLRLAALLREQGALALSEGAQIMGLGPERGLDLERLGHGARLTLCEATAEPSAGLAEAFADLRTAVALAAAAGERGRIDPDERLPDLLLARSPRLARRLERRVFGPLLDASRTDLAETVELLAANGFERAATAAALPVHRNTLGQRIARIEELTGLDLDDPGDRGSVWLAARARVANRNA